MFPKTPAITLYDPLGDLLGAGDGHFTYTFEDAVKLAGHACPTVAGAFLLVKTALEQLFPGEVAVRGDVRVTIHGAVDRDVNGPISQIITLLTGAAAQNGFHGLAGQFVRSHLLHFRETLPPGPFTFERISNRHTVQLLYSAAAFPPSPLIGEYMPLILTGRASDVQRTAFRDAWRQRVLDILADQGLHTVRQL
ncbi:MAG: hypothetical protein HQL90_13605 [Magnetococcales bacterium]|nr:hypothetical protein [Magnetococcales bacterium]